MNIRELNLSTRAKHSLLRAKINTLNDLTSKSIKDILRVWGIGPLTFNEIKVMLNKKGLEFK